MSWQVQPLSGLLPLDWGHEGDEWQHHLSQVLRERGHGGGGFSIHSEGEPFHHVVLSVTGGQLESKLWIAAFTGGALLVVAGDGDVAEETQVLPWVDAAQEASARIGKHHQEFEWSAIIGPDPDAKDGTSHSLAAATQVGPMTLTPGGRVMFEGRPGSGAQLYTTAISWSEPIVVMGASRGYSWWVANEEAFQDLHTVCGLLSVALGDTWIVREAPFPLAHGPRSVPDMIRMTGPAPENPQRAQPVEVPPWVGGAWARVASGGALSDALAAFLEGSQLQARHASVALVEFVASIETVGKLVWPARKCACCETCTAVVGSRAAFKNALALALPDADVSALLAAYPDRSATAHGGKLHGSERRFGSVYLGSRYWGGDQVMQFEWGRVYRVREATRRLLELALTGRLEFADTSA